MNDSSPLKCNSSVAEQKALLRRELIEARSSQENNEFARTQIQKNLSNLLIKKTYSEIFCYLSTPQEAPTWEFLRALLATGSNHISCPRIINKTTMLAVRLSNLSDLERGPLGIFTSPQKTAIDGPVDIAVVPGVGFTKKGVRLGYGGGYYDRWFENHPTTLRVGLCYDIQLKESLPAEPHDKLMQMIVTERDIYECE